MPSAIEQLPPRIRARNSSLCYRDRRTRGGTAQRDATGNVTADAGKSPSVTTPPTRPAEISHGAGWLAHGFHIDVHSHRDGQLVYPASGVLATTTERGTWVAPANRVTWTPPGFEHSHRFYGRTDVRLVVIPEPLCGALVAHPRRVRGESPSCARPSSR